MCIFCSKSDRSFPSDFNRLSLKVSICSDYFGLTQEESKRRVVIKQSDDISMFKVVRPDPAFNFLFP